MIPITMTNEQRRMFYQMLKALEELTKAIQTLSETEPVLPRKSPPESETTKGKQQQ